MITRRLMKPKVARGGRSLLNFTRNSSDTYSLKSAYRKKLRILILQKDCIRLLIARAGPQPGEPIRKPETIKPNE